MAEKRPSGEEIRQKMKEEYKKDLRARKEFLGKVEELRQKQQLTNAFVEITEAGNDDTDEWIAKINQETALNEAKAEVAYESAQMAEEDRKKAEEMAMTEAEMQKIAAKEMVERMKAEMAGEIVEKPESKVESKGGEELPEVDDRPSRKMLGDI
jgi:hypothetical protein